MTFSRALSPSKPNMCPLRSTTQVSNPVGSALVPARERLTSVPAVTATRRVLAYPCRPVLELIDLRRRFGDVVALDGVSFEVPPGAHRRVRGPQRRRQDHRDADRRSASSRPTRARCAGAGMRSTPGVRRRFGYMPEERGLYPKMRVLEQLVYLARLRGVPKADARARAEALLTTLEVIGDPRRSRSSRCRSAISSGCSSRRRSSTSRSCWCSTSRSPGSIPSASTCSPSVLRREAREDGVAGRLLEPPARARRAALRRGGADRPGARSRRGARSTSSAPRGPGTCGAWRSAAPTAPGGRSFPG